MRSAKEAAINQAFYDSLVIKNSKLICYIADLDTYELLYVTPVSMDLFGMTEDAQYQGQKCYKLLQGLDAPCPFCTNDKLRHLPKGEHYRWELFNKVLQS